MSSCVQAISVAILAVIMAEKIQLKRALVVEELQNEQCMQCLITKQRVHNMHELAAQY